MPAAEGGLEEWNPSPLPPKPPPTAAGADKVTANYQKAHAPKEILVRI